MARQRKGHMIRVRVSLQQWKAFQERVRLERTDPSKRIREWIGAYLAGEEEAREADAREEVQREVQEQIDSILDRFVDSLAERRGLEWDALKKFRADAAAVREEMFPGSRSSSRRGLFG